MTEEQVKEELESKETPPEAIEKIEESEEEVEEVQQERRYTPAELKRIDKRRKANRVAKASRRKNRN